MTIEAARLGLEAGLTPEGPAKAAKGSHFADRLLELVREADRVQKHAEHEAEELSAGRGGTVETMVALSKADLSLRFVTEVRNRALEAYQEIMRLQV